MQIQVSRLRQALALLEPVMVAKPTLEVLNFAHLGDGKVVATDLEVALMIELPEAVESLLLPLKDALHFLKYAPGHLEAQVSNGTGTVSITVGGMETSFKSLQAQDFPPVPRPEPAHEGVLDGDSFVRALAAVLPYAAKDDTRPVLHAVCLTLGDTVQVAAGDGFRLAWETVPGKLPGEKHLIIPPKAVELVEHLWKGVAVPELWDVSDPVRVALAKRPIRLGWTDGTLEMRLGPVVLVTKLIQGTFPDYLKLVPQDIDVTLTVPGEDMLRALQQLKQQAKETSGIVRLVWETDKLLLSAQAEEVGKTTIPIAAQATNPGRIGINISYLLEYFKGKADSVTLSLKAGSQAPVLFAHRGVPHVLIMPMFVQW